MSAFVCPWCDQETRRPVWLRFRGNRRRVRCCEICRGVVE